MSGFFKSLASILKYKPVVCRFELLEGIGGAAEDQGADGRTDANINPGENESQTRSGETRTRESESQTRSGESPNGDNEDHGGQTGGNEAQNNTTGKDTRKSMSVKEWNESKKAKSLSSQSCKVDAGNKVFRELGMNLSRIKQEFSIPSNMDIVIREFETAGKMSAFIVMIEGMVDKTTINGYILRQLMMPLNFEEYFNKSQNAQLNAVDYIMNKVLAIDQVRGETDFDRIVSRILLGDTALFIDKYETCILIDTPGFEKRNIEQPTNENVVRGAQEGFNENLKTNITLIRRIIRNKKLITELIPVGKTNNVNCAILYLQGFANPVLIQEVKRRVSSLNTDYIAGAGMLEEAISDQPYLIIPQIMTTERPDRASAMIMDGKVVIITEGTPFASAVPSVFWEGLHSSEDFFLKWQLTTAIRYIRLFALLASLILPGLYVALTTYHQEMIPTDLLTAIANSRENVPFPTIVELLMMDLAFELIREASLRMPGAMGGTIGIIGALILGQAAVSAQIVSPVLIIIVAVGAIGNFAIPSYSIAYAVRLLRFAVSIMAGLAGFYGVSVAFVIMSGFLCNMKCFGVPFLSPVSPKTGANPDIITSLPVFKHKERPDPFNTLDKKKQGTPMRGWTNKGGKRP